MLSGRVEYNGVLYTNLHMRMDFIHAMYGEYDDVIKWKHLCGEFTGDWWIPLTKASDAALWCFLWSAPEQTVEQTIETPVIRDTIAPIMTSL